MLGTNVGCCRRDEARLISEGGLRTIYPQCHPNSGQSHRPHYLVTPQSRHRPIRDLPQNHPRGPRVPGTGLSSLCIRHGHTGFRCALRRHNSKTYIFVPVKMREGPVTGALLPGRGLEVGPGDRAHDCVRSEVVLVLERADRCQGRWAVLAINGKVGAQQVQQFLRVLHIRPVHSRLQDPQVPRAGHRYRYRHWWGWGCWIDVLPCGGL